MEQITLRAETGREIGTRPSRRLRHDGKIPATLYGRGSDPLTVSVDRRELYAALHTAAGLNVLINLQVAKQKHLAVAREVQRHPVRGEIIHLDFIRISMDEAIQAEVAIEFLGTPVGVREDGGIVDTVNTSLMISALPGAIPASIPVEIGEMGVGDTFTVAMLPEIEGVRYLAEPDTPLAVVTLPAAEIAAVSAEEREEGEEAAGVEEGTAGAAAADTGSGAEEGA